MRSPAKQSKCLPVNRREMEARGWKELDILLISGDAYVDHPSFGVPLLGRLLESRGFRVGIIPQPRWDSPEEIARMGRPLLFCGVSAGCLDSMLAHYTAFRKKRHDDAYTPGGKAGARPNRACIVYANLVRQAFPGLPVVLGGVEASLRRASHYDFWTDSLRRSLLFDARADLLLYGMGERSLVETAERLRDGRGLEGIRGSARIGAEIPEGAKVIPGMEEIKEDPKRLLEATIAIEAQVQQADYAVAQAHGKHFVLLEPPPEILTSAELDALYELPFTRKSHPGYEQAVPALEMVRWSVAAVRGCGGGCSFCSLALHQGRRLRSRSEDSILREIRAFTECPDWKGSVSDIGGPTANLWGARCTANPALCRRTSCLTPSVCPKLKAPQADYLRLLRRAERLPGVKHVRVGSGVRHDLALQDREFVEGLVSEFVGGQLKLAPEHSVEQVLKLMRKSDFSLFERFLKLFTAINQKTGNEQYVVPYVMSAFPGCTVADMRAMSNWFHKQGWKPRQVQCFIPTPGTVATAMFYGGIDLDGKPIHVARSDREREDQHAILIPRNRAEQAGRGGRSGNPRRPQNPRSKKRRPRR